MRTWGSKPSLEVTGAAVALSNSTVIRCNRITHTGAYSGKQETENESMWSDSRRTQLGVE